MATTKVKPKTGAAALDESDLAPDINAPISDAQSTDLTPGGFSATPSAPGPSGPSFGMGGDVTQPSDFAKEVAEATNVPSKGGPAVETLYAESGKGPVGKLRRPQDTTSTVKAPEDRTPPPAPPLRLSQLAPDINAPVAGAAASPTTPLTAPTPTPTAAPSTAQPAPAQQQPAADQGLARGDPRALPAWQDHGALIQKYAGQYLQGDQNVSDLDPYIANDPDYAGMVNGHPIFMDSQRRVYMRDETSPGKETRHYADAQPGSQAAENGTPVVDEDKVQASRDAQVRMTALMQTRDAIEAWQAKFNAFKAKHGTEWWGGGENPIQQAALQVQMNPSTGFWPTLQKVGANIAGGTSEEMKQLEVARAQAAASYGQAWTKNLPTSPGAREMLELPNTTDDLATQQAKVNGMKEAMAREARALQVMYPHGNKKVEELLKSIGQMGGSTQQGAQPSGAQPSGDQSSAARAPDFSDDSPASKAAYAALPKGRPFRYKGQLQYKQ